MIPIKKHAKIVGEPVLSFDNQLIGAHPSIELLTIPEAAKLLKISVTSIRRLQQRRAIPFIKMGGSVRFVVKDLMTYIAKRRVESIDQ